MKHVSYGTLDWIRHDLRRCPVESHALVLVLQRNGDFSCGKAETYRWQRFYFRDDPRDITHYCVVTKPLDPVLGIEPGGTKPFDPQRETIPFPGLNR